MIIIAKESLLEKTVFKYSNAWAIATTPKQKPRDEDSKLTYQKSDLMPSQDVINGIMDGSIKMKKITNKAKKLMNSTKIDDPKDLQFVLGVTTILTMLTDGKDFPVIAFVIPEAKEGEDSSMIKKRNKFIQKYLVDVFSASGIVPITDPKKIKKIFNSKKNKKIRKNMLDFGSNHNKFVATKSTSNFVKFMLNFYGIELNYYSVRNDSIAPTDEELDEMSKKEYRDIRKKRRALINSLFECITRNNLERVDELMSNMDFKNKKADKVLKTLAKKDKKVCKAYNFAVNGLNSMTNGDIELKTFKSGYDKNMKKKKAVKRMDKQSDKLRKDRYAEALTMIYLTVGYLIVNGVKTRDFDSEATLKGLAKAMNGSFDKDVVSTYCDSLKG